MVVDIDTWGGFTEALMLARKRGADMRPYEIEAEIERLDGSIGITVLKERNMQLEEQLDFQP